MKICSKCKIEKEPDEFYKNKRNKDCLEYSCKLCNTCKKSSTYTKEYYTKNKDKKLKYQKEYNIINKDIISEYQKEYSKKYYIENKDENKDKSVEYSKKYYELNRDKIIQYSKEYYISNKEHKKEYSKGYNIINRDKNRERTKLKMKNDTIFRLSKRMRDLIIKSFRNKGYTKTSKTQEILGCSFDDLKVYIESKFEPWMNWDNKGLYNGNFYYGWDVDHIIPLSSAKTEEEIILLNHYSNLQPLCSKINRDIKKDNLTFNI
jgi:hypothetical protein